MKNLFQIPRYSLLLILCLLACLTAVPLLSAQDETGTIVRAAPPIDTAVAGLIDNLPVLLVFSVLVGLVIYLIRDRRELTALLAKAIPEDMAKTFIDTAIKGVFSALGTVNRIVPGDLDDKVVDGLAKDAGLVRVPSADGKGFSWQPLPESSTATTALTERRPFTGMERITQPDGSYSYRPGTVVAGTPRTIHEDGSFTLDSPGQLTVDAGEPQDKRIAVTVN